VTSPAVPGEDALIAALARCLPPTRQTTLSIGDDAAAILLPQGEYLLVTTDLLMEDVHFRLSWGDLPALGWKALAQNLSDIAAMGGTPTHAVIAIGVPPQWQPEQAVEVYRGLADLAARTHTDIIGGDTIRSAGPLTLSLTVLGRVLPAELLTRQGARPGDGIFVTGTLGRAAAGLRVLEDGRPIPAHLTAAVHAQLRPEPRLAAARALATSGLVTAMMDVSDGVATDLHRLCRAGGVGAVLRYAAIPVDSLVPHACAWLHAVASGVDPVMLALTGGEDFELLLTAPVGAAPALSQRVAPLRLTHIGTISESPDILITTDQQTQPLSWGFTHF
jgi:thiamine-monophosphate kinase